MKDFSDYLTWQQKQCPSHCLKQAITAVLESSPKSLISTYYKFVLGTIKEIINLLDFKCTVGP